MEAAKEFYNGVPLPMLFSPSYIVLIVEVKEHTSFDKFRPISLYSVIYKIFSKVIMGRLTSCLSRIIGLEQGASSPGHSIF